MIERVGGSPDALDRLRSRRTRPDRPHVARLETPFEYLSSTLGLAV